MRTALEALIIELPGAFWKPWERERKVKSVGDSEQVGKKDHYQQEGNRQGQMPGVHIATEVSGFGNEVVMNDLKCTHFSRGKSQSAKGTGWVEGGINTLQVRRGQIKLDGKGTIMKKTACCRKKIPDCFQLG